jgi:hypothetical protein
MKKLIVTAFALTTAASVFAQGTIVFFNFVSGGPITKVYAPLAGNTTVSQIGNGATDTPAGSTVWTGYNVIGLNGLTGQYGGNTTFAALLAAPGQNQPESSLQPATSGGITTFHTGAAGGGLVNSTTAVFNNITPDFAGGATVEMVAWDNSTGSYGTWDLAKAAWLAGTIAAGTSGPLNITGAIGGTGTPPSLPATLQSFNLYTIGGIVPEPSSFALAGLGLAALIAFRRRS